MFARSIFLALCVAGSPVLAQDYPDRSITFVVPYPPGGTIDRLARELADHLAQDWDQAVIVENHAGGNAAVGVQNVLGAEPDGYTLLIGGGSTHSVGPATDENLTYDPIADFTPVAYLGDTPMVLTAGPSFDAADLPAIVALSSGGEDLTYGSVGNSTVLAGELINRATGTKLRHVNYKQFGPVLIDLVRGDVDMAISSLSIVIGNIRQDMVRPIAVTSTERSPLLPDVPAMAETYPGFEVLIWFALFGPADLPEDIRTRLHDETDAFLNDPARKERWAQESFNLRPRSAEEFTTFIAADVAKWQQAAEEAGLAAK